MAHLRKRFIESVLNKKLKFFPVVSIQGARQTGKSVLARELFGKSVKTSKEVSFDLIEMRTIASNSPLNFLESFDDAQPLIIDEAQKVPEIFDSIKYKVDRKREPGKYLLLGSTEFSILLQIRESLTGRMGVIRLFPMIYREMHELTLNDKPLKNIHRIDFLKHIARGGMPGIFSIRGEDNRAEQYESWIDITCNRDIHQFKKLKLDGEIAREIIRLCSTLEEPTQSEIAKHTRQDTRRIKTHLNVLSALFVLYPLKPHPSGGGKIIYLPLDSGIAKHLGANQIRCIQIALMNERLLRNEVFNIKKSQFYYYRSLGKHYIHWIEVPANGAKAQAFQIIDHEKIKKTDSELMRAFLNKNKNSRGTVLGPSLQEFEVNQIKFKPWESFL